MLARLAITGITTTVLFLSTSCGEKLDAVQVTECEGSLGTITYSAQIQPIMKTYCLSCHSAQVPSSSRNGAPADANFDSYTEVSDKAQGISARIQNGSMPPASTKLSAQEQELFQCWITSGMKE